MVMELFGKRIFQKVDNRMKMSSDVHIRTLITILKFILNLMMKTKVQKINLIEAIVFRVDLEKLKIKTKTIKHNNSAQNNTTKAFKQTKFYLQANNQINS